MKPLAYPLLSDENIHGDVVAWLHAQACNVRTVFDDQLNGCADIDVLRHARANGRVVITHDSDFGTIALRQGEPIVGIIYVRPGHRAPAFTIATLLALHGSAIEVEPPFIAVVERRDNETRVRVRRPLAV